MSDDDIFAGDVAGRLFRIDRQLRVAARDAQCRDWLAERPDRVGFARLGQAGFEVRSAALRHNPFPPADDQVWPFVGGGAWLAVTLLVLLIADDPAAPLVVAVAAAAGIAAGQAAISTREWARTARVRRATAPAERETPAPPATRGKQSKAAIPGKQRKPARNQEPERQAEAATRGKQRKAARNQEPERQAEAATRGKQREPGRSQEPERQAEAATRGEQGKASRKAVPIDDPFFYADVTRRIEACAAAARVDSRRRRRGASDDLVRALDWVAAARDELVSGSWPAAQ